MRIVFFGSPEYAVPSLRACLEHPSAKVVAVVTQPDRSQGRSRKLLSTPVKQLAEEVNIESILQPEETNRATTQLLSELMPDIGVVAAYGNILPTHLLDIFPRKVLNVHASLLPRHRGASPVAAAISSGDTKTGATLMRVVRKLDAGPIIDKISVPIGPFDNTGSLTDTIAQLGADLLTKQLTPWFTNKLSETPQNESKMTYATRLTKSDGHIDWTQSATQIDRHIRAVTPWPSAVTTYQNQRFSIHEAWPVPELDTHEVPGTVITGDGSTLTPLLPDRTRRAIVACGQGSLALLRVQRPGRQAQNIESYLNGDTSFLGSQLS